ncbi:MAG TPA: DUF2497 domain-containing protein [Caulobacteraceae bacterium]
MEEILASIRRIISEDEAPAPVTADDAGTNPHGDEHEDILELTQRVDTGEEESDSGSDSIFEPEPEPAPSPALETSGDLDIYARRPQAASAADLDPAYDDVSDHEPLVSPPIAATASSAFVQLGRAVEMGQPNTLEAIVREMLRPMLKHWLDTNLPDIVEQAVQAEVERIARRRFS